MKQIYQPHKTKRKRKRQTGHNQRKNYKKDYEAHAPGLK